MDIPPELVLRLRSVRNVAILTGAGISAESGIPTFREALTGLWARYDPQELATPEAFRKDPGLVWEWYAWRRSLVLAAAPNPGHLALGTLEQKLVPAGAAFALITQNVDGLHQRAGSRHVIELHGSLLRSRCSTEGIVFDEWPESQHSPPHCPRCGANLRPDVVWFGESLPQAAYQAALSASEACDLFVSIGTSSLVQPAASLPVIAMQHGAALVEVNPTTTPLTHLAHFSLRRSAGEALPAWIAELN